MEGSLFFLHSLFPFILTSFLGALAYFCSTIEYSTFRRLKIYKYNTINYSIKMEQNEKTVMAYFQKIPVTGKRYE